MFPNDDASLEGMRTVLVTLVLALIGCGRFLESPEAPPNDDAGVLAPPMLPTIEPPTKPTMPCMSAAAESVCEHTCAGDACPAEIVCPPGRGCRLVCEAAGCAGRAIVCPDGPLPCTIDCRGAGACLDSIVHGAEAGQVRIRCDDVGGDSCGTLACDVEVSPPNRTLCTRVAGAAGAAFSSSCGALCREKTVFIP